MALRALVPSMVLMFLMYLMPSMPLLTQTAPLDLSDSLNCDGSHGAIVSNGFYLR